MITTAKQNLKAPNGLKITIGMEVNILFRGESVIVCKDSQSFTTNLDTAQYCFNI